MANVFSFSSFLKSKSTKKKAAKGAIFASEMWSSVQVFEYYQNIEHCVHIL